jgi:hypothetical protein
MKFGPLGVYVPVAGSPVEKTVDPRSAIVGTRASDWLGARPTTVSALSDADNSALCIDYEGGRHAANIKTFADRCLHAGGRHVEHYPTVARMFIADTELQLVGEFDGERVTVSDIDALADWLQVDDLAGELVLS